MPDGMKKLFKENWGFILFIFLMFASRSSIADWYIVPTGSMLPTIVEGDRVYVDKMAYRLDIPFTDIPLMETGSPERGDIVVFVYKAADERMIKRVVGLPGDKVAMYKNRLMLNGEYLEYQSSDNAQEFTEMLDQVAHQVQFVPVDRAPDSFKEVTVPSGHYLVLGDNRNRSADSRFYGFVPAQEIQGKALNVIMSHDYDNYYLPREGRNLIPLI